jgi:hypothetical protein
VGRGQHRRRIRVLLLDTHARVICASSLYYFFFGFSFSFSGYDFVVVVGLAPSLLCRPLPLPLS